MGLLPDSYYDNLSKGPAPAPQPQTPQPAAGQPAPQPQPQQPAAPMPNLSVVQDPNKPAVASPGSTSPTATPGVTVDNGSAVRLFGDMSPEEQTNLYGGPVGSAAYYQGKADHPYLNWLPKQLPSALGLRLPDDETWDKMSWEDRTATMAKAGAMAAGRMAVDLPQAIVRAPIQVASTIVAPWQHLLTTGKLASPEELGQDKPWSVPFLGSIPNLYQTRQQAMDGGMGPLLSILYSGSDTLANATIAGSLAESIAAAARPRGKIEPGVPLTDTKPIKDAVIQENNGMKGLVKPKGSVSEYYTLPKSVAKDSYGANPLTAHNTFLKVTPAGESGVEVSVVQVRRGLTGKVQDGIDYFKEKVGIPNKAVQGDFGPEVKLDSKVLKTPSLNVGNDAITQEAMKYKSADEFINSKPALYREASRNEVLSSNLGGTGEKLASPNLDLALGQGRNKNGIVMKIRTQDGALTTNFGSEVGIGNLENKHIESILIPKDSLNKMYEFGDGKSSPGILRSQLEANGYDINKARDVENPGATRQGVAYVEIPNDNFSLTNIHNKALNSNPNVIHINSEDSSMARTAMNTMSEEDAAKITSSIPPKALKGFEKAPITEDQMTHLRDISRINGIEPAISDAVVRTVTGKDVVGELTQSDYVKAAQTLARFSDLSKYSDGTPSPNMFTQYAAPQRHWMRTYEEKSGIPLYSQVYAPMEDSIRLRDTFRDASRTEAHSFMPPDAENRRLVGAYMKGNTDAILKNPALSEADKTSLVDAAGKLREMFNKTGPKLDVPTDIFKENYLPGIRNIGGVYQMYKEGAEIPKQMDFFAKFKKVGDPMGEQIDDPWALFDIYANAGSNHTFVGPQLERIANFADTLPDSLKNSVKSYVQEKLGYSGKMEQFIDSFVPKINDNLGLNLPADSARQLTNLGMSSLYSGLLSSPSTWFRQTFQYPLFGYARLGADFAGAAVKEGLSAEGMQAAREAGVLVDLGVPYGEELTKDTTVLGRAGNVYKNVTQKAIRPNSMADNGMRSIVFHQAKMQWDDALAKYNGGKLTWPQLESKLDFSSFSSVDRNLMRQKLVAGDMDGAFRNYAREIVDETNFPYRKGASARISYGLGGKLGTSMLQWPIEAASTLTRWAKTGQWEKLIRFYASSAAIQKTMQQTFGFDYTKAVTTGPFNNIYSPFVKTAIDATNAFTAMMQNNRADFNKNRDAVVKSLKSFMPLGVERNNISNFWKSYNAGPTPDGKYGVLNPTTGDMQYTTDFAGLVWGQLMGFPTKDKIDSQNLETDMKNAQTDQTDAKKQVMQLIQQEKYDDATKIMQATGVTVTAKDLDNYYIPLNQRTFQLLPAQAKAQFAGRVYPSQ